MGFYFFGSYPHGFEKRKLDRFEIKLFCVKGQSEYAIICRAVCLCYYVFVLSFEHDYNVFVDMFFENAAYIPHIDRFVIDRENGIS